MGSIFTADGCTEAPAGADPPASLPLPSSNSHLKSPAFCSANLCFRVGHWTDATPWDGPRPRVERAKELSGDATLSRQPKQTRCSRNSGATPDPGGHRHVTEMRGARNIFSPLLQFSISVDAKHGRNDDDNQSPVGSHCQHSSPVYEARETVTNRRPLRDSRWKIPCR